MTASSIYDNMKIELPLNGVNLKWVDNRDRMVYKQEKNRKKDDTK